MTRLALIGNGKWGNNYLSEVKKLKDVNIVYVKTYDWKDLIGKKDIDGIIIATPDNTHTEIINAFPDTFLLVEKPLTTSLKEAMTIVNTKVMAGYIYLYNLALQEQMKDIGQIHKIDFQLVNKEKEKGTTPLWYLASHPISFCMLHLGKPQSIIAEKKKDVLFISLKYKLAECKIEVGWGVAENKRKIVIEGDKKISFDGTEEQKITPLENELQAFVNFIKGSAVPSNLKFAQQVTSVLSEIEQLVQ